MGDNNTVSMTINGRKYVFAIGHEFGQIPTSETLCQTLRNRLDLTGNVMTGTLDFMSFCEKSGYVCNSLSG